MSIQIMSSNNDDIYIYGDGSKPWYLVNPKIAGKWMFIPLKMYL
jgi:hypothetical protein